MLRPSTGERLLRKGDYINGSFLKPERVDGYITAVNPGDRSDVLGRFPFSLRSVEEAIEFGTRGAKVWRRVSLPERAAAVRRFRDQLQGAQEVMAQLVTRETGKPLWEARQEVAGAVRSIDLYLEEGLSLLSPRVVEEITARSDWQPRGLIGMVCPYNLPVLVGATTAAAVLLAGNALVVKPSKFTPGVGQLIAELWDRCKLPRGVYSMVHGSGSVVGQRLVGDPALDALLFFGSHASAREIRVQLADRPELPAWFHCGGKGVALVLEDAEIDRAVYEVMIGAFLSSGQRHNSTARVIVADAVYERFTARLLQQARKIKVGYGFDPDVLMGPLISENYRTRFRKFCQSLIARRHTPLLEGEPVEVSGLRGSYVRPAIFAMQPDAGDLVLEEEPPGPVLMVYRVSGWEAAMNLHNRLSSRLSTSVFLTPTHPGLLDLQAGLKTGALNLNRSTVGSSLRLPSVGLGRSSNGAFTGLDLLRVLTVPRSMLVETRPFDANHVVPGVSWLDPEEPEATLELSLEAAMEQGLDLGATAVEVEPVGDDQR